MAAFPPSWLMAEVRLQLKAFGSQFHELSSNPFNICVWPPLTQTDKQCSGQLLGVLQSNPILTRSTQRRCQIPQGKSSVLQDWTSSPLQTPVKAQIVTCVSHPLAIHWGPNDPLLGLQTPITSPGCYWYS